MTATVPLDREAEFIRRVAREAGAILQGRFGSIKTWKVKTSPGDIVTEADHAVEDLVLARLADEFPSHNLLTEERGWVRSDPEQPTWILDPLDGTRNFALRIPTFSVSIACVVDGAPVLGVVFDPVHDEMFHARRGRGAFVNETPLAVGQNTDLYDGLVSVSWSSHREDSAYFLQTISRVNEHTTWFRRIGSAALVMSYIASGRFDAYIQGGINAWDIAAGILLVEEAGGVVTSFSGGPIDLFSSDINLLAANPAIHELLVRDIMPG